MFSPHHRAALAAVTENDRRSGADDTCPVELNVAAAHVFVQELHHRIGKSVGSGMAEIVLGHWAIAVGFLRWSMDCFAAGEDESNELAVEGCFEHVGHAENVDASGERSIFIDERTHHIG